jgi:hypothetical protein
MDEGKFKKNKITSFIQMYPNNISYKNSLGNI